MKRLALAAVALAACTGGTETGNPVTAELRMHGHSSMPHDVAVTTSAGGAVVTGMWMRVPGLAMLDADCATQVASADGMGARDYTMPTLVELAVDDAPMCAVQIALDPQAPAPTGAPPELANQTVLVTGARADGTPFVIRSAKAGTLAIREVAGHFHLTAAAPGLLLGFDVATWLRDLDLASASPGGDGVIRIDATNDPLRAAAFEAAFARGAELFHDVNQNGEVDGPEDALLARGTALTP
jgi:hypothetical protein